MLEYIKINDISFCVNLYKASYDSGELVLGITGRGVVDTKSADIVLCGFNTLGSVDLLAEAREETDNLYNLARLSQTLDTTLICGIKSHINGSTCDSVVVCSKGVLVDIVSPTHITTSGVCGSDKIKLFATDYGKIALFVSSDCLVESNWQAVSNLADIVVCVSNSRTSLLSGECHMFGQVYQVPFVFVDNSEIVSSLE